jgi:hypothetical protein
MNLFNKLVIATAITLSFTACKKQIDLRPTDTIIEEEAFLSIDDLEKGLNSVYSSFGAGQVNGIYIAAILADETRISSENRGQGQAAFKWQYTAGTGEVTGDYSTYFRAINRAQRVLAAVERVSVPASAQSRLERVKAELAALRGMSYFELLKRYMKQGYDPASLGIPVTFSTDLFQKPSRNTVAETVTQIELDLSTARASASIPNAEVDGLRISKASIAGYQARLALIKKEWDKVVTYTTDAITLSGKTIATRAQYADIWKDASNTEVVLRFRNNYSIKFTWRDSNGDVFFEPSMKLKNQYNRTTDVRFTNFFGAQGSDTSTVTKYPGSSFGPNFNDVKDIRVSEMYLARAEAYAELDQLDKAAADLNAVRSGRISGYVDVTLPTKGDAITAILNERFKELAFEGFRFFDLKRRVLPIERLAVDVQSNAWQSLPADNFRFALPIPQTEIFTNPNTQQNNNY